MKRLAIISIILAFIACPVWGDIGQCEDTASLEYRPVEQAHDLFIYPVVRVTSGQAAGSGTILYSKLNCNDKYSTYVLTNFHVIADSISIVDEWDSAIKEEVKKEKRALVYVEMFQYKDISTPVGTLKVEAEIVIYNKDEDMALLKLSSEHQSPYVAKLRTKEEADKFLVMDRSLAVGCSLAFPPLPTTGVITRKNFQVDSYPYHMSSSQIIYGNSGGAMFHEKSGDLIGIPSLVAIAGWSTPITHMGLFIPISRVYAWFAKEHYDFIYDPAKNEKDCLDEREKEIKAKKEANLKK